VHPPQQIPRRSRRHQSWGQGRTTVFFHHRHRRSPVPFPPHTPSPDFIDLHQRAIAAASQLYALSQLHLPFLSLSATLPSAPSWTVGSPAHTARSTRKTDRRPTRHPSSQLQNKAILPLISIKGTLPASESLWAIMDQQQQPPTGGVPGPTGRRLHIAHRRSPSELTPLMSMYANPGSRYLLEIFFFFLLGMLL
jgi:hypothetical protein